MPRYPVWDCPDVSIAIGQQFSNAIRMDLVHGDAEDLLLMCSQVDALRTYRIQINQSRDGSGSWYDLHDGTNNIAPPSAVNRASVYPFINFTFRIAADAVVAGVCTWKVGKTISLNN